MRSLRYVLLAFLLFGTPLMAAAHGSGQHVLGVVTVIDTTHLEVKTPKGQSVSVRLTDKTVYKAKNHKMKTMPKVGDRVVVEAEKETTGLVATEVHFSDSKPKPTP